MNKTLKECSLTVRYELDRRLNYEKEASFTLPSTVDREVICIPKGDHYRHVIALSLSERLKYHLVVYNIFNALPDSFFYLNSQCDRRFSAQKINGYLNWRSLTNEIESLKRFKSEVENLEREKKYIVRIDFQAHLENIDHYILFTQMRRFGVSEKQVEALSSLLRSFGIEKKGLVVNSVVSELLASLYFFPLDYRYSREKGSYLRFGDDLYFFTDSYSDAKRIWVGVRNFANDSRLKISDKSFLKKINRTHSRKSKNVKLAFLRAIALGGRGPLRSAALTLYLVSFLKFRPQHWAKELSQLLKTTDIPISHAVQCQVLAMLRSKTIKNEFLIYKTLQILNTVEGYQLEKKKLEEFYYSQENFPKALVYRARIS